MRRKATSGVLIDPGREPLPGVVEKGEAVPPDEEDEDPLLLEVSSSPKNPPRAAGSVVNSREAKRSMRILVEKS